MEAPFVEVLWNLDNGFSFYERVSSFDVLKEQKDPNGDVAGILVGLLGSNAYAQYFFSDFDNPSWLRPLDQLGAFDNILEPVVTADGMVSAPQWFPGLYLVNAAESDPNLVIELAERVNTNNWRVFLSLIDAGERLSGEHASRLARLLHGMPL